MPEVFENDFEKTLASFTDGYFINGQSEYDDIKVVWTGYSDEHQFFVYNMRTKRIIYSQTLNCRLLWTYDTEWIAECFAESTFLNSGRNILYDSHPYLAGLYGPDGFIRNLTDDEEKLVKVAIREN
ncbi:MAG: hypothetical protein ACNFW9_02460 [Candidatus Kerfeldbacteria bacterium]|jgi:hypothetical protein